MWDTNAAALQLGSGEGAIVTTVATPSCPAGEKTDGRSNINGPDEGASVTATHPAAIRDFSPSTSKLRSQRFLCLMEFPCRFLCGCSNATFDLTNSLSGTKGSYKLPPDTFLSSDDMNSALGGAFLVTRPSPARPSPS
nr:unnamed protein product [Spirometra erinaceieuropaei]